MYYLKPHAMRKSMFIIPILFILSTGYSVAQFTFSVRPGLQLNGATFGYYNKNIVLCGGLQFGNVTTKYEDDNSSNKTKLHLYMPYIGGKFFIAEKESLRSSITVSVFKPILAGKEIVDGIEDEDFKVNLKENKLWGGQLGFETEYFFHERFSVGGEFGIRLGSYNYDDIDNDYKDVINLNMTYVSISMNFYL